MANIARKTAAQLGLTSPQAAAYDAIIANAANYTDLQGSLLQMTTTSELQSQFNGLLPDYAGGGFDFVTRGSRQAAQHISDDSSLFTISNTGVWLEPMVFHATKHDTDSIGYSLTGGGVTLGLERTTAIGNVGVYFDWTTGNVKNNNDQSMHVSNIEFNAFWRKAFGRLYVRAGRLWPLELPHHAHLHRCGRLPRSATRPRATGRATCWRPAAACPTRCR
jgi:hypothetical protein